MAVELLAGEPKEGESRKAIIACNDWLRLGAGRSLGALVQKYTETNQSKPPTVSISTVKEWSMRFGWEERAKEYDAAFEAAKDARRKEVMESGLALEYERVNELSEIYAKLKEEFAKNGLWYTDTKLSSTGMTVDVEVFNKALIDSLRGVLDDFAKETGGRKQKNETELSGMLGYKFIEGVSADDR